MLGTRESMLQGEGHNIVGEMICWRGPQCIQCIYERIQGGYFKSLNTFIESPSRFKSYNDSLEDGC